jgi:hypothetical protein
VTVKKVENKTVYYKETVEGRHLIFWSGSQRRVHCDTTEPEGFSVPGLLVSVCVCVCVLLRTVYVCYRGFSVLGALSLHSKQVFTV